MLCSALLCRYHCCPTDSESSQRGKRRELRESEGTYENPRTAHFFHPAAGMGMAHACQVGLGGMTSGINRRYRLRSEARTRTGDEVTYMFVCFFLSSSPAGKRQMR